MTTNSLLTFSIIIPTYERPHQLRRCLTALTQLDYPKECFEIIVVNDGSTLPLEDVVDQFRSTVNLQLVNAPHGGPAAARNAGALCATGEYLAFTDDDCAPTPQWLKVFASVFSAMEDDRKNSCILGGYIRNLLSRNAYSSASQLLVDYLYEYYDKERYGKFFTSNNFALSAHAFWELSGFDETFPPAGEDRDFCRRALAANMTLQFVPEAEVGHFHALTLRKFSRQHFSYGKGAFHFHERRVQEAATSGGSTPRLFLGLPKPEPIAFYLDLMRYPWRVRSEHHLSSMRALRLSVLLFLSQVCNALGYFRRRFFSAL